MATKKLKEGKPKEKRDEALAPVQDLSIPGREDAIDIPVESLQARLDDLKKLQSIIKKQLIKDIDYGEIKGVSKKPSLFKPGAEKMAKLLGLSDTYETEDAIRDFGKPMFHYEIKCRLRSIKSGIVISEGVGECNSMESKYAYRWVLEKNIPPKYRSLKDQLEWKQFTGRYGPFKKYRIPNDDIYSQINTIKKMAKKRALVDAALSAGRLSQLFTQDLEDMDDVRDYVNAQVVENQQEKKKPAPKKKTPTPPEAGPREEEPPMPTEEPGQPVQVKQKKQTKQKAKAKAPAARSSSEISALIKQDFSIRFGQLKNNGWEDKYRAFKKYLFEVLGPQKERSFVEINQYGHLSFSASDKKELNLLWDNFPYALKLWMDWEKEQKEKEIEDEDEIPF